MILRLAGLALICGASWAWAEGLRPVARPDDGPPPADLALVAPAPVAAEAAVPVAEAVEPASLPAPVEAGPALGPETNLPLPRFVSLKSDEGNARRGPSLSHRIDWVFVAEDMPLQIVAEYGHWRRVLDRDGMGGWVHYSLLSGSRTVIVTAAMQPLYTRASEDTPVVAQLEAGVIARVEECLANWCRLNAGGYRGWAPKTALWGVGADELLD